MAACAASSSPSSAPEPPKIDEPAAETDTVRAWGARLVDEGWTTGLAIGVVVDGKRETYAFGRSGTPDELPVDQAVFEIGSITKVFTSTCLASAVQDGEAELSTTLADAMKGTEAVAGPVGAITLEQLATHTSGLPRMPDNFEPTDLEDPYADYTQEKLFEFLQSVEALEDEPPVAYSNLGAALLGQALAQLTEAPTSGELIRQRITEPLGMNATTTSDPASGFAQGHDEFGRPVSAWHATSFEAAGALRSTLDDMLTFAEANLHPERHGRLGEALAATHEVHARSGPMSLGLGWHVGLPDMPEVRWHNGGTGGFRSVLAFDPERDIAVVILANQATGMIDRLGLAILHHLRGEPFELELPEAVALSPEAIERVLGTYRLMPGFELEVQRVGDALGVMATGQGTVRILPRSETEFTAPSVGARLVFELPEAGGKATELTLHQGGMVQRASRIEPSTNAGGDGA